MTVKRIALLGFGEVGQILAADIRSPIAERIAAWDVLFDAPDSTPSLALAAGSATASASCADAVSEADIVISAVTAANTVEVAAQAAEGIKNGSWFLDLNSASPAAKRAAALLIEAAGGRYVEAAVMSPVPPRRISAPILLGGKHAVDFLSVAESLGFSGMSVYADELGKASAAKMCRSIVVKGVEALLFESLVAARAYRVEEIVIDSLDNLFSGPDWRALSRYMISRMLEHGGRRAEEMREVAVTIKDAGLTPAMSLACAERQEFAADFADAGKSTNLNAMLDAIIAQAKDGPCS